MDIRREILREYHPGCRSGHLGGSITRLDAAEFKVIMHVHDEPVAEHPEDDDRLEEFNNIVAEAPEWATGLPYSRGSVERKRYKK